MATTAPRVRVLVCTAMPHVRPAIESAISRLADRVQVTFTTSPTDDGFDAEIGEAEVVYADPGLVAPAIDAGRAGRLSWLQSTFAGVDAFFADGVPKGRSDYVLTRMGEGMEDCMAEWALLGMLTLHRRLPSMMQAQADTTWAQKESAVYEPLAHLQLGMLGCGRLGTAVAQAAAGAFGMKVVGFRRRVSDPEPPFSEVTADVVSVFASSRFVVNLLPSTAATHHLLTHELLAEAAARRDPGTPPPVFLNAGRGSIIDEAVLVRALDEGLVGGAFLDVFEVEPLPESSKLWSHPKVIITPHVASNSLPQQCAAVFATNLEAYLTSGPEAMKYLVNWEDGY